MMEGRMLKVDDRIPLTKEQRISLTKENRIPLSERDRIYLINALLNRIRYEFIGQIQGTNRRTYQILSPFNNLFLIDLWKSALYILKMSSNINYKKDEKDKSEYEVILLEVKDYASKIIEMYDTQIKSFNNKGEKVGFVIVRIGLNWTIKVGGNPLDSDFVQAEDITIFEKTDTDIVDFCSIIYKSISSENIFNRPISKLGLSDFIRPEFLERILSIEQKLKDKVISWQEGTNKIECASFCELLFDKKYFIKGATRINTVNRFACSQYGIDITIQLQAAKKGDRMHHRDLLKKQFT